MTKCHFIQVQSKQQKLKNERIRTKSYLPFFTVLSISHIFIVNDEREDLKQKDRWSFALSISPLSPLLYSPWASMYLALWKCLRSPSTHVSRAERQSLKSIDHTVSNLSNSSCFVSTKLASICLSFVFKNELSIPIRILVTASFTDWLKEFAERTCCEDQKILKYR